MKARMGAIRGLCLAILTALVAAGLGAVATPASHAADPSFPSPTSPRWVAVAKSAAPMTDEAGDISTTHLDLTASGGVLGPATGFVSADLQYLYFRMHVSAGLPGGATGGYVVQIDTDANTAGWERAIRYDVGADTIAIYSADSPNSGVKGTGTVLSSVPATAVNATSYAGAAGGAHVVFAVARPALTTAGVDLSKPIRLVMGTSTEAGVGLNAGGLLVQVTADVLGTGTFGLSTPGWNTLAADAIDIDSDGDGVVDRDDNCPRDANPDQADDDAAIDNSLPPGTIGQPDGTEGKGNVCDPTPRGYDLDGDDVGLLDDDCPERPGLQDNGCVARSGTTAILRYLPRKTKFTGVVHADYDECVPRRNVAIFRFVLGAPDRLIGSTRTDAAGRYALDRSSRPKKGKYYAQVDRKSIFDVGVSCFGVKSPKIEIR
jgi:hypothetical protein